MRPVYKRRYADDEERDDYRYRYNGQHAAAASTFSRSGSGDFAPRGRAQILNMSPDRSDRCVQFFSCFISGVHGACAVELRRAAHRENELKSAGAMRCGARRRRCRRAARRCRRSPIIRFASRRCQDAPICRCRRLRATIGACRRRRCRRGALNVATTRRRRRRRRLLAFTRSRTAAAATCLDRATMNERHRCTAATSRRLARWRRPTRELCANTAIGDQATTTLAARDLPTATTRLEALMVGVFCSLSSRSLSFAARRRSSPPRAPKSLGRAAARDVSPIRGELLPTTVRFMKRERGGNSWRGSSRASSSSSSYRGRGGRPPPQSSRGGRGGRGGGRPPRIEMSPIRAAGEYDDAPKQREAKKRNGENASAFLNISRMHILGRRANDERRGDGGDGGEGDDSGHGAEKRARQRSPSPSRSRSQSAASSQPRSRSRTLTPDAPTTTKNSGTLTTIGGDGCVKRRVAIDDDDDENRRQETMLCAAFLPTAAAAAALLNVDALMQPRRSAQTSAMSTRVAATPCFGRLSSLLCAAGG